MSAVGRLRQQQMRAGLAGLCGVLAVQLPAFSSGRLLLLVSVTELRGVAQVCWHYASSV